ncbi:MAG TPA: MurR/RpiR family transcriptional regulator [Candidatus Acidoferrales bacterium]|nr:MurR/RpiR family transcriptional regulator [Candidatus Acidoferrales bacterium]
MQPRNASRSAPRRWVDADDLVKKLGRKRSEIIRPAIEHPKEFVLLSVRDMARRLGTDPATAVRIFQGLGFSSYREFQRYLHELSIAHATLLDTMQAKDARESSVSATVRTSLVQELKNIHALQNTLDAERIATLVRRIYKARQILLIGGDLAATLAQYLEYYLTVLGLPAISATTPGRTVHLARSTTRKDLVIAMSFRRGLRQTVEGVERARKNGAHCVGITDTFVSPLIRFCDECLLASVETPAFGQSYVAPIALMNAILAACGNFKRARTLALLREADLEQRSGFRWYEA